MSVSGSNLRWVRFGGLLRTGRRRETITPIAWERPFLGSQKFLMPDLVIEHEDRRVFIDAKYKDHWEALQQHRWLDLEENVREKHREDLLQVLAYSTLSESKVIVACLVYPCTIETWATLKERGTVSHRAAVYAGTRKIDLVMLAVPLTDQVGEIVGTAECCFSLHNMILMAATIFGFWQRVQLPRRVTRPGFQSW